MSASSTAIVSLLSIASDLTLHVLNYGMPMPTSAQFFLSEQGLALAGTTTGVAATAIAGGITSGELDDWVSRIPTDYDKKLAKTMIASSVINTKMLAQGGVGIVYALLTGRPTAELKSWASYQFLPSLILHGAVAGVLPYVL